MWCIYMGGDHVDWKATGRIPPQSRNNSDGGAKLEKDVQELCFHPIRRCHVGGGIGDDRDLHLHRPEYGRVVH